MSNGSLEAAPGKQPTQTHWQTSSCRALDAGKGVIEAETGINDPAQGLQGLEAVPV